MRRSRSPAIGAPQVLTQLVAERRSAAVGQILGARQQQAALPTEGPLGRTFRVAEHRISLLLQERDRVEDERCRARHSIDGDECDAAISVRAFQSRERSAVSYPSMTQRAGGQDLVQHAYPDSRVDS